MTTKPLIFSGGGTGGSLVPLLAVAKKLKEKNDRLPILFLTTNGEAELRLIRGSGFAYRVFPAGKWRRYSDWKNIRDLFVIAFAFLLSLWVMARLRPRGFVTAGSFASVPQVWAASIFRVPILVHQQDVRPGLANRLMAPFAKVLTVVFQETASRFKTRGAILWTGNPVRSEVLHGHPERLRSELRLTPDTPVLLVLGGSSGAAALNMLIQAVAPLLRESCEILHVVGKHGKRLTPSTLNHHIIPFLTNELPDAYALADVVITRAGLSTLTEIGVLRKAALVIPMPGTHQEENAEYLARQHAIRLLDQRTLTPSQLAQEVQQLLSQPTRRQQLGEALGRCVRSDGTEQIVTTIEHLLNNQV